jgi:GNAT superfamily N-acetyltransferase
MLKLKPPISNAYKHLFDAHTHNLAAISIYRGLSDVNVYVDSDASWLVTRVNHRVLVSGDYMSSEAIEAVQRVVEEGITSGRRGFVIYYPSDVENTGIGEHIHGVKPYPNQRNYYRLELGKSGYPVDLPDGYRIERVTEDFLGQGYENNGLVSEEMMSERANVADFLEKSFAFCALLGDVIVAWCMSEYNAGGGFEIGIETHEDHRRKGLAVQTARACFNNGVEKGFRYVGWHCWKKNEPSNKTALRLGFKHVLEYPVEYLEVV